MQLKHLGFCLLASFFFSSVNAQPSVKKVLFLGNSYTQFNNLPELTRQFALANGDTLQYQSNTPGGYTFQNHFNNVSSVELIQSQDWNFVVLQEQSQLPAFPDGQFYTDSYPFALSLDSLIKAANPCAHTLFYRTWGRKNGDADNCQFFPPLCTYEGMDSMLAIRYKEMAQATGAQISPVGAVWKYLRQHHPEIELYHPDESHPSLAGSFAAAATFYTLIFGNDPASSPFTGSLNPLVAEQIKQAAQSVVWDNLTLYQQFDPMPQSGFSFEVEEQSLVHFQNNSIEADSWWWDFGDGNFSEAANPDHAYDAPGSYQVCLSAIQGACDTSVICKEVTVGPVSVVEREAENLLLLPNPVVDRLQVKGLSQASKYRVMSIDGRKLQEGLLNPDDAFIRVAGFSKGIYLLQFQLPKGERSLMKWVKE